MTLADKTDKEKLFEERLAALSVECNTWKEHAQNWESVSRNMAQVLTNTIHYAGVRPLTTDEISALRDTFRNQCSAHSVTP